MAATEDQGWRVERAHSHDSVRVPLEIRDEHPTCAAERSDVVPGLVHVRGALSPCECERMVAMAEDCGFDNAHHPDYQDARIDKLEERYRRNNRMVYRASTAEADRLFRRVRSAVPALIDAREEYFTDGDEERQAPDTDYGLWKPDSLNEMFRFYRYRKGEEFPVHQDSVTVKVRGRYASWFSVLFYLSEGFQGGGTAFFDKSFQPVHEVTPQRGDAVIFFHHGLKSPRHAGLPVTDEDLVKYVLRSDVMYLAETPAERGPTRMLSPPYDDSDSD
eukprot:TRINITY_DN10945_c0_g1_i1.p1 TRINITY_DN10945_c0_g1~~TRINITY_DN10945_c0_g1_i1.p1  ORF type:complete len:292 (+),score=89.21 TRINITY_DN10945_c0_g1_i1:53-877(+)